MILLQSLIITGKFNITTKMICKHAIAARVEYEIFIANYYNQIDRLSQLFPFRTEKLQPDLPLLPLIWKLH